VQVTEIDVAKSLVEQLDSTPLEGLNEFINGLSTERQSLLFPEAASAPAIALRVKTMP
jgi:hypothetical protein